MVNVGFTTGIFVMQHSASTKAISPQAGQRPRIRCLCRATDTGGRLPAEADVLPKWFGPRLSTTALTKVF